MAGDPLPASSSSKAASRALLAYPTKRSLRALELSFRSAAAANCRRMTSVTGVGGSSLPSLLSSFDTSYFPFTMAMEHLPKYKVRAIVLFDKLALN